MFANIIKKSCFIRMNAFTKLRNAKNPIRFSVKLRLAAVFYNKIIRFCPPVLNVKVA